MKKVWISQFVLTLTSIMVVVIAFETCLRFTEYRFISFPKADWPDGYFREDPVVGAEHTENYPPAPFRFKGAERMIFTNSLGCFDEERPVTEGYVLALGDSFTWGYAPLGEMWTTHLKRFSGRQVLKCGVTGTGPRHYLRKAENVIKHTGRSPGIVLVLYNGTTDLNDDAVFPGYEVVGGQRVYNLKSLDLRTGRIALYRREDIEKRLQASRKTGGIERSPPDANLVIVGLLANLRERVAERLANLRKRLRTPGSAEEPQSTITDRYELNLLDVDVERHRWVHQAFEEHLATLRELRRLASLQGAVFVLVFIGVRHGALHDRLREFFRAELPFWFDLDAYLRTEARGQRLTYRFDGHWNALGNRLAAEGIYKYLASQRIFEKPGIIDRQPSAARQAENGLQLGLE